jgi:hypothetical protein
MRAFGRGGADVAVIDLPFKLVIVAIVMAVSTAALYSGLDAFYRSDAEASARAAAERISTTATEVSAMGVGSSRTLDVELRSNPMYPIERMDVGCGPSGSGTECTTIRYRLAGHTTWVYVRDAADRDLELRGVGMALALGPGHMGLLLTKTARADGSGSYIEVRTL